MWSVHGPSRCYKSCNKSAIQSRLAGEECPSVSLGNGPVEPAQNDDTIDESAPSTVR